MLRHANYSITADTYTTVLQESQAALAEGMAGVVPRLRPVARLVGYSRPTTPPHPHPDPRDSAAWP